MSYKGMNSPIDNKIANPLKKTDKEKLKRRHTENLARTGVRQPKSPLV